MRWNPDSRSGRIQCPVAAISSLFFLALTPASRAGPATHPAVQLARRFAEERLASPGCRAMYADFTDVAGRPLSSRLNALGMSPAEHLSTLVFEDADRDPLCRSALIMAFTVVGRPVVHVCTSRFAQKAAVNIGFATAAVIHEQLHALGLGENPPASEEITRRVLDHCGR